MFETSLTFEVYDFNIQYLAYARQTLGPIIIIFNIIINLYN